MTYKIHKLRCKHCGTDKGLYYCPYCGYRTAVILCKGCLKKHLTAHAFEHLEFEE